MLPRQCADYQLDVPSWMNQWTNIKFPYATLTKKPPTGMAGMLKVLKLPLEGRHHSGIDDCRNIAKIVLNLLQRGIVLQPTGKNEPNGSYTRLDSFPPPQNSNNR